MKRAPLFILIVVCAGCARVTTNIPPAPPASATQRPAPSPSQSAQLAAAVRHLGKGEVPAARKLLTAVADAPAVPGVTDEALFRLALLSVRPGADNTQTHLLLRRLKKEYPASPWTAQAQPLAEQLSASDELRRQNRSYRTQRDALGRENSDLKETIEQLKKNIEELKHLDLELEKKSR